MLLLSLLVAVGVLKFYMEHCFDDIFFLVIFGVEGLFYYLWFSVEFFSEGFFSFSLIDDIIRHVMILFGRILSLQLFEFSSSSGANLNVIFMYLFIDNPVWIIEIFVHDERKFSKIIQPGPQYITRFNVNWINCNATGPVISFCLVFVVCWVSCAACPIGRPHCCIDVAFCCIDTTYRGSD